MTQQGIQTEPIVDEQPQNESVRTEEFELSGDQVVAKVKELIHQGNIRRIILQTQEGKTLLEVPLTIGVAGGAAVTILVPVLAAIGALAAIVAKLKIRVERVGEA